jgi:2-oxoglutarate ferredoxin oxidoreductase subunit delta
MRSAKESTKKAWCYRLAMDRGFVETNPNECKGCGLCVEACPPKALRLWVGLNRSGYHPAEYKGEGCTGCGVCYYACPEPGGIRVLRRVA